MSYFGIPLRNGVGLGLSSTTGLRNAAINAGASLSLNFQSATLDSRITFTRSTTGTFTGSNGLIQSAAINAPRFDYDPITLACKGLLIEEQRVNLLTYSEQFDNAAWPKADVTVTANAITAPDGTLTADKLIASATTANHLLNRASAFAVTSGTAYTHMMYAKVGEYSFLRLQFQAINFPTVWANFNLSTGTIGLTSGSPSASITSVGNGWYRCFITATATGTGNSGVQPFVLNSDRSDASLAYLGDGTSGIYIWGAQLEAGAFATSYIPTVASQVTRTADNASMTGTNFSSWYNQTQGTFATSFDNIGFTVGSTRILGVSDGTGNNRIRLIINTSTSLRSTINVSAVEQALLDSTITNVTTGTHKLSVAYALDSFAQSADAGTAATDNSGTIPTVNLLAIGQFEGTGGNYLNGHIQNISYYPRRLTNAELQAITA